VCICRLRIACVHRGVRVRQAVNKTSAVRKVLYEIRGVQDHSSRPRPRPTPSVAYIPKLCNSHVCSKYVAGVRLSHVQNDMRCR